MPARGDRTPEWFAPVRHECVCSPVSCDPTCPRCVRHGLTRCKPSTNPARSTP